MNPDDLSNRERAAVEAELQCLADDEFVMAERYIDWQVRGPTLEADLAVANIAQDEYGHARLWYDLLEDFGYEEPDLIWERDPSDFRHTTMAELAFETGDWADCVLRGYLYDHFERLRLEALEDTSYPRIADRVGKVLGEEHYHRDHTSNWLERLTEGKDASSEAIQRLQSALDRLYPHAQTMFAPTEHEDDIVDLGVRTAPLSELREDWLAITTPFLEGLGMTVPDPELPDVRGRDGSHTDDWQGLYDEFTYTYEMLGREPAKLMADPDEADV
ncbi:phenylacetate-CoA oxygenase subunit PaaC [Natronomonas salina]|uniref:1,2-phenylacetyl-CoA epoxidase subunit PaaC n=1 Tax=Natronomonas salina TaxID=1710540 RepID=UPI0015B596DF|nr:1,2-phenylacetyl-CoA epoxidase subunit PaaC [Natronomonas salina]QLD88214.1 phenylacetate-CoA oxygenase subunit PaaC [Natronomonas salina]